MPASAIDVRRWLSGFEAAERASVEALRAHGPQRVRSIALSLSLLHSARAAAGGRYPLDLRRADSDAAVRLVWERLRARVRR
jgi:hypothetical protein